MDCKDVYIVILERRSGNVRKKKRKRGIGDVSKNEKWKRRSKFTWLMYTLKKEATLTAEAVSYTHLTLPTTRRV